MLHSRVFSDFVNIVKIGKFFIKGRRIENNKKLKTKLLILDTLKHFCNNHDYDKRNDW